MTDARIARLYARMDEVVRDYPAHAVVRAPAFALGTAFFPIGAGLWDPRAPLPEAATMIVAHVFDAPSVAYALGPGGGNERIARNRTWRGLRRLLDDAGVAIESCFLTNAYMGVKRGNACGAVGGGRDYVTACAAFLAEQVRTVRPRVVATLGTPAMRALGAASDDLRVRRHGRTTLDALDRASPPQHSVADVAFGEHVVARVVALNHTCSWASRRTYDGEVGARADAAILRDASRAANVSRHDATSRRDLPAC